jgi:gamma-glutamyltranspeptidase/glutathione hydrolase
MQQAFADRSAHMGDPDFSSIPAKELTSDQYAELVANGLSSHTFKKPGDVSTWSKENKSLPKKDSPETTHFSIMTSNGDVVSSTQTINGGFGSLVVAKGTGILLNNEMDDFGLSVGASNMFGAIGGSKNLIQPLKRPLSSMSPTIIVKNKQPILSIGSPNGTRIITCTTQVLLNYFFYGYSLQESVSLKRFHHQWMPDELWMEEGMTSNDVISELTAKGHHPKIQKIPCKVQAVANESGTLVGASDPRGLGMAVGQ